MTDAKLNLQFRIEAVQRALAIPNLPPVVLGLPVALLAARCLTKNGGLRDLARWIVAHEQAVTAAYDDPELLEIIKDLDDDSFDRAAQDTEQNNETTHT